MKACKQGSNVTLKQSEFEEFKRMNMGMEVDIWLSCDSSLLPVPDSSLMGDDIELVHE